MQQRAGLARALVLKPASVADGTRPFGAAGCPDGASLLQEELVRILEQEQRTMVFITHSIDEAIVLGDRIVVMSTRPGAHPRGAGGRSAAAAQTVQLARTSARYAALRQHIWEELRPPGQRPPVVADHRMTTVVFGRRGSARAPASANAVAPAALVRKASRERCSSGPYGWPRWSC